MAQFVESSFPASVFRRRALYISSCLAAWGFYYILHAYIGSYSVVLFSIFAWLLLHVLCACVGHFAFRILLGMLYIGSDICLLFAPGCLVACFPLPCLVIDIPVDVMFRAPCQLGQVLFHDACFFAKIWFLFVFLLHIAIVS